MEKSPNLQTDRFEVCASEIEVNEELWFHIEMQALDYEREGLTAEEALAKAAVRFGDVGHIKRQCLQIRTRSSAGTWAMKILFTITFFLGVAVRILSPDEHVTHVGDILIMIAVLGSLLLFGMRLGSAAFKPEGKSIQLGLREADSIPLSFDEKGRTPFDCVRSS